MKAARMGAGAVKKPKVTPWFRIGYEGHPARAGWYDVQYSGDPLPAFMRRYFDGRKWRESPGNPETAFGNLKGFPEDKWRGLAADPAKAGA